MLALGENGVSYSSGGVQQNTLYALPAIAVEVEGGGLTIRQRVTAQPLTLLLGSGGALERSRVDRGKGLSQGGLVDI